MTVAAYYLGVNVSWSEARLTDVVVQSCNQRPDLNWLAGCPSTVEAASCSSSDVLLDRHWEPTSGHDRGPHPNQLLFLVISVRPLTITSTHRRWREVFLMTLQKGPKMDPVSPGLLVPYLHPMAFTDHFLAIVLMCSWRLNCCEDRTCSFSQNRPIALQRLSAFPFP